jgi:predicted ATP-dependent Lon-type protease
MDKEPEHNSTKRRLIFKIGDLVVFKPEASDIAYKDKDRIWLIKDYVNKAPEEHSCYDYVLTDATEEMVAIEYELQGVESEDC